MFENKCDNKYRIVMTRVLKWQIIGIPKISFDSYWTAKEYLLNQL